MQPGCVTQRPALALQMVEIITFWSGVEALLGQILATLVRSSASPVIEEFFSLRNTSKQREKLEEKASHILPVYALDALSVGLILFAKESKIRNRIVHYNSGISPHVVDAILLQDPKHAVRHAVKMAELVDNLDPYNPDGSRRVPIPQMDLKSVYVYRQKDFDDIKRSMHEVHIIVSLLAFQLQPRWRHDQRFEQLESMPRFQEGFRRLREGRQTTQAAPRE